ncbi:MAG: TetR/AcrR family transcriptional regulator [Solirubrobacterales bacterium]|nr:TetR/AcrR family transcriptional regulator [Solirubrobacterales bacterium]
MEATAPPRPGRRAERRVATRDAIVAGTLSLVAEGGWSAASMHDVARRAGVATGSLYRHFPSKGELLAEVFTEASGREQELVGTIAADPAHPPLDRLGGAVRAFAHRAATAPKLAYALMAEPVDPAVETARLASKRGYQAIFAALLEAAVAAGEIAPLDAPLAAAAIVGALQEALLGSLSAGRTSDALVEGLVTFTINAVGGRA